MTSSLLFVRTYKHPSLWTEFHEISNFDRADSLQLIKEFVLLSAFFLHFRQW